MLQMMVSGWHVNFVKMPSTIVMLSILFSIKKKNLLAVEFTQRWKLPDKLLLYNDYRRVIMLISYRHANRQKLPSLGQIIQILQPILSTWVESPVPSLVCHQLSFMHQKTCWETIYRQMFHLIAKYYLDEILESIHYNEQKRAAKNKQGRRGEMQKAVEKQDLKLCISFALKEQLLHC